MKKRTIKTWVSADGSTATVCTGAHTTQIVGLDDARRWVAFYTREANRPKFGHHYVAKRDAFKDVLALMTQRQADSDGGHSRKTG